MNFNLLNILKKGLTRDEIISISKKLNLRPKDFIRRKDKIVIELELEKELENDDKILDADQVKQNFIACKSRFSIA